MNVTQKESDAIEYAVSLDKTLRFDTGINWHWVYGFTTKAIAELFIIYLNRHNLDNRGIYNGSVKGTFDVRFRQL